jgi:hypothetical protein
MAADVFESTAAFSLILESGEQSDSRKLYRNEPQVDDDLP